MARKEVCNVGRMEGKHESQRYASKKDKMWYEKEGKGRTNLNDGMRKEESKGYNYIERMERRNVCGKEVRECGRL